MNMTETTSFSLTEKPKPYIDAATGFALVKAAYLALTINGVDDKAGLEAVHTARVNCRDMRTEVEKTRKTLVADAVEYQRKVNAYASDLKDEIQPVEDYLKGQEDAIEIEKARIKTAAEDALFNDRSRQIQEAGGSPPDRRILVKYRDDEFKGLLESMATAARVRREREEEEARQQQLQKEIAEANFKESQRLQEERRQIDLERRAGEREAEKQRAIEQAKLDEQRAEIKRQQDEIDRQRKAQEDALRKIEEDKRVEAARVEAAAQAVRDEQARRERIEKAKEETRKAEEAAAKRAEELRPVKETLEMFANQVDMMSIPRLPPETLDRVRHAVGYLVDSIRGIAKDL